MRRVLAAALVVGAALLPAVRAGAATQAGPASVQLQEQTPWLQGNGLYTLRVALPSAAPTDRVQVTVFDQVIARTSFQADAQGHVNAYQRYQQVVPVSDLTPAAGGYQIQVPVNRPAPAGDQFGTLSLPQTGVFPVQVALYSASGSPMGPPLTTFIVYAISLASSGQVKPLAAALVIPFASDPVVSASGGLGVPGAAEARRLGGLAAALDADSSVKASILASPLTIDELAGGSITDRRILESLSGASEGGPFQVLPSPYSPVSLGSLQELAPAEVAPQLSSASTTLESALGSSPDPSTWVVDGPLDGATLDVLIAHGAKRVVVPESDLTDLPAEIQITYAGSTYLDYGGSQLQVIGADSGLTADFTRDEPPVLAANQLLAELAMIYTEAPNPLSPRGLVVLPPAGWSASPQFVSTLLSGLHGNPLLSAVSVSGLFSALGSPQGTRYLGAKQGGSALDLSPAAAAGISQARTQIDDLRQVLPTSPQVRKLQQELLLAESAPLSGAQRGAVMRAIGAATAQVQHVASLPPATSITLTSTRGQIPLTILAEAGVHPRVEVKLISQRLIFRPFAPRGGRCTVVTETQETCTLTLVSQNTTLKVPVETRSSGVFPLDVYLYGGSRFLAHDQNTVRSTAVSGAAVIVIIVALMALVLWWGRDLRRNRRPKGMVPSPLADLNGNGEVTAGDPDVDGFFEQPPPDYGSGSMSPSGVAPGPSKMTDTHDRAGETRKQ